MCSEVLKEAKLLCSILESFLKQGIYGANLLKKIRKMFLIIFKLGKKHELLVLRGITAN